MLSDNRPAVYELHWMRHADRYLALVRAELAKDPQDDQLRELLDAMQAAVAVKSMQSLH